MYSFRTTFIFWFTFTNKGNSNKDPFPFSTYDITLRKWSGLWTRDKIGKSRTKSESAFLGRVLRKESWRIRRRFGRIVGISKRLKIMDDLYAFSNVIRIIVLLIIVIVIVLLVHW